MTRRIGPVDRLLAFLIRREVPGRARLHRRLRGNNAAYPIRSRTRHGLTLLLVPGEYIDERVLRSGYYEVEVLEAVLRHLPPDGTFWDVGAHIGLHALTVQSLRPDSRVVCFEPAIASFLRLRENARLNNLTVGALNVGLAERGGYRELSVPPPGNAGLSSFEPWAGVDYVDAHPCRCEAGDDLVERGVLPAPDVVKLDVEGGEMDVLKGMSRVLSAGGVRAIVFEHAGGSAGNGQEGEILGWLRGLGYDLQPLGGPTAASPDPVVNWLAVRPPGAPEPSTGSGGR